MEISLFLGALPEQTKFASQVLDVDFSDLGNVVCSHCWSPGVFRQKKTIGASGAEISGLHRANDNLVKIELLTLDFDSGPPLNETIKQIERLGYQAIIGTTRSHQKEKKRPNGQSIPPCDRYRVVIPLGSSIESDKDFKATWFSALKEFPGIDKSCKDSARFYYPCRVIVKTLPGRPFPVCLASDGPLINPPQLTGGQKGKLSAGTYRFIAQGALDGEWHQAFFKASMDLKQNGYSIDEAKTMLQKAATNPTRTLDGTDLSQLKDIYENRTPKYPARIKPGYKLKTLRELYDTPEEECSWIVDQLLPSSGVSVLAGKPKAGKTTLSRCLALSVARGQDFLGKRTSGGCVLILALEEKEAEVKRHFKAMGASENENIYIHSAIAPEKPIDDLRPIISEKKPVLVVIDPLFRFMRVRDSNDYAGVTNSFEPIIQLARDYNAHLMFVHHLGKGDRQGADAILGSTAIFGAVDTGIILKRIENYRTISSQQRYGQDLDETVLNFDEESKTVSLGETKQEVDTDKVGEEILEVLAGPDSPLTEAEINNEVTGKTKLKRDALRKLVAMGKITRTGLGGKKDPYKYQWVDKSPVFDVPNVSNYIGEQGNMNLTPPAKEEHPNV